MKKKSKGNDLPEWAGQITALRVRSGINQAELARRMECSAMTISRWERGLLQPSAEHFIQLGNLGEKSEAWFFWEMAGIQAAKMVQAVSTFPAGRSLPAPLLQGAIAGPATVRHERLSRVVGLPLLKAIVGTHGVAGDRRSSLRSIPASEIVGAPASWCPNPAYTSLLRVKGHSMEPLIRDGDVLAVDAYQTEREQLYGKIVIACSDQKGLCVSRLRRFDGLEVLEGENRQYDPVVLSKASGWRIVGKVLWWISAAP
jgi:SOS-response transcriptional repressor LexA